MFSAYFLGSLMDQITARRFALILGGLLILLMLIQSVVNRPVFSAEKDDNQNG